MYAYGRIKDKPAQACDLYTKQCAISVNTKDLATMAATLANGGKNPVTNKQVLETEYVPSVLAVMATAGMYDDSGKWRYYAGACQERCRRRRHRRVARQVGHCLDLAAAE
jgi:glutaminase